MWPNNIVNLFGASGHAKVIMDILSEKGVETACLYDDNPRYTLLNGKPVYKASDVNVCEPLIVSIGSNRIRKIISDRYNVKYATAIHPDSSISSSAKLGDGTVVMQGAVIQADVFVGRHCIINTGATVDHECRIGDFAHIAPV